LIKINPEPHMEELLKAAREVLPSQWQPENASVRLDTGRVTVKVANYDQALLTQHQESFEQKTGYQLVVEMPVIADGTTNNGAGKYNRMEANTAFAKIREVFADKPYTHQPLKIGQKGDTIEITFITAEIGARYHQELVLLEHNTGYQMRVRENPDQIKLQLLAKEFIPKEWGIKREPGINLAEKTVTVVISSGVGMSYAGQAVAERFYQATGWQLMLKWERGR
ncbi:MAG: hypothetical protein AB1489_42465, partial [Acidobacteriota bacterium]